MRIAITDSWPNNPANAEYEFNQRFKIAAAKLGHEASIVVTSNDIESFSPDFVICTHEFTPKLTKFITFGALWSPPDFYFQDKNRISSILSYDAYLAGSEIVRKFISDLYFPNKVTKPVSDFDFLPVTNRYDFHERHDSSERGLAYLGVNWDGLRHIEFLSNLIKDNCINIYGPKNSWEKIKKNYKGEIPFDGISTVKTLQKHGIALCIHKQEHVKANTPSMRLFEAAAAGCVIITDKMEFTENHLKNSALFIDVNQSSIGISQSIQNYLKWIKNNPKEANIMARNAHLKLNEEINLEKLISKTCNFYDEYKRNNDQKIYQIQTSQINNKSLHRASCIDLFIINNDNNFNHLNNTLLSIKNQILNNIRVIVVSSDNNDEIIKNIEKSIVENMNIEFVEVKSSKFESNLVWEGLKRVESDFFSILHNNDSFFPEHFYILFKNKQSNSRYKFIYSNSVNILNNEKFVSQKNFSGSKNILIKENRELNLLSKLLLDDFLDFKVIRISWIASRNLLDKIILIDPNLNLLWPNYLYLYFYFKSKLIFESRVTSFTSVFEKPNFNEKEFEMVIKKEKNYIFLRLREMAIFNSINIAEILQSLIDNKKIQNDQFEKQKLRKKGIFKYFLYQISYYAKYREWRRNKRNKNKLYL